jgi:anaerobic ribonucleoside-triphosphate reductase
MEECKKVICHDCGKTLKKGDEYVNFTKDEKEYLVKCKECYEKNPVMEDYQECDVYSRVVGFHTPIQRWNKGKSEEWKDRKTFDVEGDDKKKDEGCSC